MTHPSNKRSHALYWLISPTYKYAEKRKAALLHDGNGRDSLAHAIKRYNRYYLYVTIALAVAVGLFYSQALYRHPHYKYINYSICIGVGYFILLSRGVEIFKAFLEDAVEKLNGTPSKSALNFGDRLKLAFTSYIELLVGFGVLYYVLPAKLFKGSVSCFNFSSIIEAISFSGVTMSTVGYGDVSPASWLTQCMVLFQVFCSLTLALVSFTVYTSLALAGQLPASQGSNQQPRE